MSSPSSARDWCVTITSPPHLIEFWRRVLRAHSTAVHSSKRELLFFLLSWSFDYFPYFGSFSDHVCRMIRRTRVPPYFGRLTGNEHKHLVIIVITWWTNRLLRWIFWALITKSYVFVRMKIERKKKCINV